MKVDNPYRLIISGGGTGGHIYPAIAIAKAFCLRYPKAEVLFVGAKGKMEMTSVPQAGYKIIGLWISGFVRGKIFPNLLLPFKIIISLFVALKVVKQYKPHVAIGTGGYASVPMMMAAIFWRIPSLLQEQNSFPGIANKLFAKRAKRICVAYSDMGVFFPPSKISLTGNPIRKDIIDIANKRSEALNKFNFYNSKNTLLVLGGSGGASTINESVFMKLDQIISSGTQLIWQTGNGYYSGVHQRLEGKDLSNIRIFGFLTEMDLAYSVADVVISRAGAIAISELCIAKKAIILVPSPNVAEDHQTKNAMALSLQEAAIVVRDEEAKEKMIPQALALINDRPKCNVLIDNISKLGRPNATEEIIDEIEKLLK